MTTAAQRPAPSAESIGLPEDDHDYWKQVQEEFRGAPPFLRFLGIDRKHCAMLNWGLLKEWHERQCQILMVLDHYPLRGVPFTFFLVAGGAGLLAGFIALGVSGLPWSDWRTWFYVLLCGLGLGAGGWVQGELYAAWKRFKAVYDDVDVLGVFADDPLASCVPIEGRTVMPHLAYIAEENYFSDGENIILVCVMRRGTTGEDLRRMTYRQLYSLAPARPDWTGVVARAIDSRMATVRSAASRRRNAKMRRRNWLTKKTALFVAFGIIGFLGFVNIVGIRGDQPPIDPRSIAGGASEAVTGPAVPPGAGAPADEPTPVPTPARR